MLLVAALRASALAPAPPAPPEPGASESTSEEAVTLPEVVIDLREPGKVVRDKTKAFDESRDNFLLPKTGTTSSSLSRQAIEDLPQGTDASMDKLILQLPGVSYDSAMSNPAYHVRNEYSNVQYRINGIQLPDGVSGFGQIVETGFVGSLKLLDGALPAQYGLRTAGVIDLAARSEYPPSGVVGVYGGTLWTVSPSFEYGEQTGAVEYFAAGRYFRSDQGLENAMPTFYPLHDRTEQWKGFAYLSALLGEESRLTDLAGVSLNRFQIPNIVGQVPLGNFGDSEFSSADLNENQHEAYAFDVLALQTKGALYDSQLAVFARYALVHFIPDVYGDLAFNDVASDVTRESFLAGIQFDFAYRLCDAQVLRAGFGVTSEDTHVDNLATVLPLGPGGMPLPNPIAVDDHTGKIGWNIGGYLQDEWRVATNTTVNVGLRFDQMYQFVTSNQLSPRAAVVYEPVAGLALHAGYARYFTPPMQSEATPTNLALFNNTTLQPAIAANSPVLPERAHYFDLGVDVRPLPGLRVNAAAYYKLTTDFLDDGQFGQATVLTQLNYAQAYSEGVELSLTYLAGGLRAYGSVSANITKAMGVTTNQYLFDPLEFAYLATHYHTTDDAQTVTASAGASYRWGGFLLSADGVYGSGLPSGFANTDHVPGYAVLNAAVAKEFDVWQTGKPVALRLSVANLLDTTYLLRSGTGVGQFAPQYGPRRGFFFGLSQKL